MLNRTNRNVEIIYIERKQNGIYLAQNDYGWIRSLGNNETMPWWLAQQRETVRGRPTDVNTKLYGESWELACIIDFINTTGINPWIQTMGEQEEEKKKIRIMLEENFDGFMMWHTFQSYTTDWINLEVGIPMGCTISPPCSAWPWKWSWKHQSDMLTQRTSETVVKCTCLRRLWTMRSLCAHQRRIQEGC